jgi:hypothetical protein
MIIKIGADKDIANDSGDKLKLVKIKERTP